MPKSVARRKVGALRTQISEVVKATRTKRGLSQSAVAALAGVSPVRMVEIEGQDTNPRIDTVEKVANALGISFTVNVAA